MDSEETTAAQRWIHSLDAVTSQNPHADDPRFMQKNQMNNCAARYTTFCRCARELSEENTRCKYQYYRAQIACTADILDIWNERRSRGACPLDVPPDRSTIHLRQ